MTTSATSEAVLLLGFNRPEKLKELIDVVRTAEPPRVYLALDGPRENRHSERQLVLANQELATQIDWGADVHTLFREQNLGCARAVSTAISWFFDHEEQGIILEDDVVPGPHFFRFAESMLWQHRNDASILAVCGSTSVPPRHHADGSFRFSRYRFVWGWGTWRDRWSLIRLGHDGLARRSATDAPARPLRRLPESGSSLGPVL